MVVVGFWLLVLGSDPEVSTGFQALIEHFNGRWQAKVWQRFRFLDYADL